MSKPRKFFKSGYQHICQISADHGLIIYNIIDAIVLLSVLSVHASRRGISILAMTIMLNHFHIEAKFTSAKQMDSFMNGATSSFARMYNAWYGLEGQVFQKPYCSSPKVKEEKIRDTFIYIAKNSIEKKACSNAWDYRFNFLKYLETEHPYSEEINYATASKALVSAIHKVRKMRDNNDPLGYYYLNSTLESLCEAEKQQFIDYVIALFNPLDKKTILEIYGNTNNLKTAIDAVMGAEYEITDDTHAEDYRHYYKMCNILVKRNIDLSTTRPKVGLKNGPTFGKIPKVGSKTNPAFSKSEGWLKNSANLRQIAEGCAKKCSNTQHGPQTTGLNSTTIALGTAHKPLVLEEDELHELWRTFRMETGATDYEIRKFFHLLDDNQ